MWQKSIRSFFYAFESTANFTGICQLRFSVCNAILLVSTVIQVRFTHADKLFPSGEKFYIRTAYLNLRVKHACSKLVGKQNLEKSMVLTYFINLNTLLSQFVVSIGNSLLHLGCIIAWHIQPLNSKFIQFLRIIYLLHIVQIYGINHAANTSQIYLHGFNKNCTVV